MDDLVTGATTEVELTVDLPPEQLWDLVSDVTRIGEWSPECVGAHWTRREGDRPRAGDRFRARNEYRDGFVATVECVVTEADRPSVFAWVVLDDDGVVDRPGSLWRYGLRPAGGGTTVTHTFVHGPGLTGLRVGSERSPGRADDVVTGRLAELRRNMAATLRAMTCAAGG
ncbi:SRPBCC family protein [Kitasatospora sp. NBC_00315]|uniref:SRPBCC family protein n=1 Tax=Kitasatospora sp. NBC_00315 TaxID=2975963 RepID=UPI00324E20EA